MGVDLAWLGMSRPVGLALGDKELGTGRPRRSMPQSSGSDRSSARRVLESVRGSGSVLPSMTDTSTTAVYDSVLAWLLTVLPHAAFHRPTCKRLALLVTGLLAGDDATAGGLAAALHPLAITPAQELRACDFSCTEVELLAEDGGRRGVGAYLAPYERSVLVVSLALEDLPPRLAQRGLSSALLFGFSTPLSWS